MKWRAYGRNAILIDFAERADDKAFRQCRAIIQALSENFSESPVPALVEYVPGYTTVLLEFDLSGGESLPELADRTVAFLKQHSAARLPPGPLHQIPVHYGGPDLQRVAEHHGLTEDRVIELHSAPTYQVYLLGFSPGFPYLGALDSRLWTPRLLSPRPRVAAGSVAIGGEHTGIYTVDSPGGWNIIGRTGVKLFDLAREQPDQPENIFALKIGDRVQFVPT